MAGLDETGVLLPSLAEAEASLLLFKRYFCIFHLIFISRRIGLNYSPPLAIGTAADSCFHLFLWFAVLNDSNEGH